MKSVAILLLIVFASGIPAFAEDRSIVVWLDPQQIPPKLTIYSDEKTESKRGVSLSDAAMILRGAQGWGSAVSVFILSETPVETKDYVVLLEGMKENEWLILTAIEVSQGGKFSERAARLLKYFKIPPSDEELN